ncbi:MAG: helix-turn-helix transcriptional regulator [Clostridia bacterium]|nr:helix-turn-helix transcriptional regulator [Clostridia bacterium]
MSNNLGELIKKQRKKLGLEQRQVAKMMGITNVSLCKVQTGERKLSKQKMKLLADVLQVDCKNIFECVVDDVDFEIKSARDRLSQLDENMILLLDELLKDQDNVGVLYEVIAILNKSNKEEKNNLEEMLKLLKVGLYNIS